MLRKAIIKKATHALTRAHPQAVITAVGGGGRGHAQYRHVHCSHSSRVSRATGLQSQSCRYNDEVIADSCYSTLLLLLLLVPR